MSALRISITTEPIEFSIQGQLHTGPVMVSCFFSIDFINDIDLGFFLPLISNAEPLYAMVAVASRYF